MTTFYAFCRVVDDIADDPELDPLSKRTQLNRWAAVVEKRESPAETLEREVMDLLARHGGIDPSLLREIIRGMEMDLGRVRYASYEELQEYCYRVACAVGLVSIEIFGARTLQAPRYAIELGHALQLTNIIRDVGEDLRSADRIYLPQEDMKRFGVTEEGLRSGRPGDGFRALLTLQAERAGARFAAARQHYPERDRQALRASELMRRLYQALLEKMSRDGFRVLDQRYRLGSVQKLLLLLSSMTFG
jgi:phytoene synthase